MSLLRRPPPIAPLPVLCLVGLFLLVGMDCSSNNKNAIPTDIQFRADGVLDFIRPDSSIIIRIAIEIADTDSAQARGLMDRRSLPNRGGMLFVNTAPRQQSFWMKSTPLPLDILFIGVDSSVVNIAKKTRPYSEDRIESTGPAQFVLEVRSGFTDRYGIDETTRLRWRRQVIDS